MKTIIFVPRKVVTPIIKAIIKVLEKDPDYSIKVASDLKIPIEADCIIVPAENPHRIGAFVFPPLADSFRENNAFVKKIIGYLEDDTFVSFTDCLGESIGFSTKGRILRRLRNSSGSCVGRDLNNLNWWYDTQFIEIKDFYGTNAGERALKSVIEN